MLKREMLLLKKSKELSKRVFELTQNAPKKFRFSLIGKMQNTSLDIISNIYNANETFIDLKLLKDLDKSIESLQKKVCKDKEAKYYTQNKLLTLKLTRATKFEERISKRLDYSYKALTDVKKLDFLVNLAGELNCITSRHQEILSELIHDVRNLIAAWIKKDRKRFDY